MVDVLAQLSGPLVAASDSPGRISMRGGGSAANTACWLAAAGAEALFVGCVGDDLPGREAAETLRAAGVRTALEGGPSRPTGAVVVLVGPARGRPVGAQSRGNRRPD